MALNPQASLEPGSMDAAERLKDIIVNRASDDQPLRLGDLWKGDAPGPVLLCLFRRWGCSLCRMHATQISSLKPYMEAKNVRVVGIGLERIGLEEFTEEGFFDSPIYLDEGKQSYKALACAKNTWKNLWGLLSEDVNRLYQQSQKRGFKNNFSGNRNQLGVTLLIAPGGALMYGHYQSSESFEPNLRELLRSLGISLPDNVDPYEVTPPRSSIFRPSLRNDG
jgi:prostamide/prostaglandin F2alpha synthase